MTHDADMIIVGSGPAGIAAGASLQDAGISVVILEKGCLAQAITQWPVYMTFFSTAENVELPGFPLVLTHEKPTREEYLNYLRRYVLAKKLDVRTGHNVLSITPGSDEGFSVSGEDEWGKPFTLLSRFVTIATGAYEIPKKLNVPGDDLHKVSHYYTEVHPYVGKKVIVVGGRNGAAEAALLLWRAGADVTIVYRGEKMQPLKWWLEPDLENRLQNGEIRGYFSADIVEIRPYEVDIRQGDGNVVTVENDYVLAMTGYRPDTNLLLEAGVYVDAETNRPKINPDTMETNVPGLFVAGVIAAGDISNEIFIENSRTHGELILKGIGAYQSMQRA